MKTLQLVAVAVLWSATLWAADPPLGRLPDGTLYILNEVQFALRADAARAISPADATRRPADKARLAGLHPAIQEVVATHTAAERWLNGLPLPAALKHSGAEVPLIARSLTARLKPGQDAATVLGALQQHPDVEWASLNVLHPPALIPNDTFWTNQWGPVRVRADAAWDVPPASTTLRVAIVDTGVDLTHPDLAARITYNRGFAGNTSGDARRDVRGGSSIDHGTHVAGIAAAIHDNNLGIAGIATVEIMAMGCAVWDGTNQYLIGSAADAINDAVANGAAVINCSFGNASLNSGTRAALDNAQANNVVVVAAAGNQTNDVDNAASGSAGWNQHPWPIIVSNTQQGDSLNPSSNYGPAIDLAAPGTTIFSTITTNYAGPNPNGNYGNMSGTSMSAPCVAGGAALVRAMAPNLVNGAAARDLLARMAQDIGAPGRDTNYGVGMLQLDPTFLWTVRNAAVFMGPNPTLTENGTYANPYSTFGFALPNTPPGGQLVLNGAITNLTEYHYPPVSITQPLRLTAFPDRPVFIGR